MSTLTTVSTPPYPGGGTEIHGGASIAIVVAVIAVVVDFEHGAPTSPANVAASYQLAQRLSALKGVTGVRSYVTVEPTLTLTAYQTLYAQPRSSLPAAAQSLLTNLTGSSIAVLDVANPYFVTRRTTSCVRFARPTPSRARPCR